jgi:hypothetical protein
MEGNTLMNQKLKQCVMEMLRMGEDPEEIAESCRESLNYLHSLKTYEPNHDLADFYRAYKDAYFRP